MRAIIGKRYWVMIALAIVPAIAAAQIAKPGTAPAAGPDAPSADPQSEKPIVPEQEFDSALPPLSGDINAPLEAMPSADAAPQTAQPASTLPPAGPEDPQLAQPLAPLSSFDAVPLETAADIKDKNAPEIRYETVIKGLDDVKLTDRFKALSALRDGGGKAANATQVSARGREDEALAVRLMKSLGYYDGTAVSTIDTIPTEPGKLRATVSATPGRLYTLSSVTVNTQPTTPPDLVRRELPLKIGNPIDADRIQGAEANVSLMLPQQGYPFVKVGDRDVLLDDATPTGAYTLPVDTGPRSSFGAITTPEQGRVFELDHLAVFPRFKQGELYDNRKVDDMRDALTATGIFSTLSVEPVQTGKILPDGTEQVDLLVRQEKGKTRSVAGAAGYSTGEGFRLEASYTTRNVFPPEGALIFSGVAGTQEQGLGATFRRQNAGKRDRTVTFTASAAHSSYDAFNAYTGTLSGRISYDSTPIWQKKFTYAYGFEFVGTNESVYDPDFVYDFGRGAKTRKTYFIAALPGQAVFDRSDDLLNPTKGYRLKINASPETAVQGGVKPYLRAMIEGTFYYPTTKSLVLAGRVRAGTIVGTGRDDLAPSRRYYGGGGGSVRGYGFQRLGPFDPNGDPIGGRSLNEFSLEARYRIGNFGIVPFFDGGNAYESSLPKGGDLRYGAGIGGRFYTNFGPLRFDVATPLNPRPGDGKVALYISIGQAF